MLRIWYKNPGGDFRYRKGQWVELPEGPFPITHAELVRARDLFREERAKSTALFLGKDMAPNTAARWALDQVHPGLKDFDLLVLGTAVVQETIRTQEVAR